MLYAPIETDNEKFRRITPWEKREERKKNSDRNKLNGLSDNNGQETLTELNLEGK